MRYLTGRRSVRRGCVWSGKCPLEMCLVGEVSIGDVSGQGNVCRGSVHRRQVRQVNIKPKGKLLRGLKNDIRNLVNFHASSRKSENFIPGHIPNGHFPKELLPEGMFLVGEMSLGKCPSGKSPSGKRPSGKCLSGKCPLGKCPSGMWPLEKYPSGNCPDTQFFRLLSALMKVDPIPHGIFETARSRFIQILHRCSVS